MSVLKTLYFYLLLLMIFLLNVRAYLPGMKYNFYHTVNNKEGSKFSFRNLVIRFESNDVVSEEESLIMDNVNKPIDFPDDLANENDEMKGRLTTPNPMQISGTKRPAYQRDGEVVTKRPQEIEEKASLQKPKPFSVKAWISRHEHKQVDYPTNDEIPGLKELLQLAPLVVPHRLRHDHKKQKAGIETSSPITYIEGPIDDEDYSLVAFSTQKSGKFKNESIVESQKTSTTSKSEKSTKLPKTTKQATARKKVTSSSNETEAASDEKAKTKALSPEDERILAFFGSFFESEEKIEGDYESDTSNETSNQWVLTAREILHPDPLERDESELRALLSNMSELERDMGSSHGDHGASFILPVLKTVEYDNNSVPVVFADIPVNIRVAFNVIHLGNFDSLNMDYSIDLEMHMNWFDVRLANNYSKPIRIREKEVLDLIWRPDPYFVNSKFSYFHVVSFPNFRMRVMPNGLVFYTLRVTLLPVCLMTFCRHPHDSQQCDLKVSSIAYPRSFVNFSWHSEPVHYNNEVSLPELRIKKLFTENCRVEGKLVSSSCLRLGILLERDGARYIVEKYIPSTLAMMFAWVAPYVPYNYEDVRIITPITVLLTLVQMEKGDNEIHTSYLTSIDIWFVAMKTFSVMSLVESLVVLALIKRARGMEKQMARAPSEYAKEKFRVQKRRLTELYHRLDTASRFMSPTIFICFFVYYVLYITQRKETDCIGKSIFDI